MFLEIILVIIGISLFVLSIYGLIKTRSMEKTPEQIKAVKVLKIVGVAGFVLAVIFINILGVKTKKTKTVSAANKNDNLNMHISYSDELQGKVDVDLLKTILNNFVQNCEGIKKYSDRVEGIEVLVRKHKKDNYMLYRQEEYEWFNEIEIKIKIKETPSLIIQNKLISGHTLWFFLGGGLKPGIEIMKDESALFFGIDKSQIKSGENLYIPVSGYEVIDNLVKEN